MGYILAYRNPYKGIIVNLRMKECVKCLRDESQVKLVDAIYDRELVKICEECALEEKVPIVRMPTSSQLNESERPRTVRERLARMAGVRLKEQEIRDIKEKAGVCDVRREVTLDKLRKPKDYSKIIQDNAELARKRNQPLDLIDNWNWHIQMARRNRKISLIQLSGMIGESELILKMAEQGNLPDDGSRIIAKLETFFRIKLKKSEALKEQERIREATKTMKEPARILNFKPDSLKDITLSDLKRMKDERERAEKGDWKQAEKLAWKGREKQDKKTEEETESVIGSDIEILDD